MSESEEARMSGSEEARMSESEEARMSVFVIPSWYPDHRHHLLGGVFVEEAVFALARHHPEMNLHVSLWAQGHRELSSARLREWLAAPRPDGPPRPTRVQRAANVVEHSSPTWTWRFDFARGNLTGVLRANRVNLVRARAESDIHLLHAHVSAPAGSVARQLSKESGIPYIVTEHMAPFPFRHYVKHGEIVPEVRESLRDARCVTAVSGPLAERIRDAVGVEPVVIPNGVDEAFFSPGVADEIAPVRPTDGFTFLTVASLDPRKGIADLLQAIARLETVPGARFRIAGSGPRAAEYRRLATTLGVHGRITWLGSLARERVRDEMRACDAFVLASHHESFGVVFAEALACGKPVIATPCGGPEDIVRDVNGVLVPVGDVPALAQALTAFASRERAFDAAAIRADFAARFASRVVADRFVSLYRDVVGAR
jgi:glycosyltransferase involved in cell wall biosynthesis